MFFFWVANKAQLDTDAAIGILRKKLQNKAILIIKIEKQNEIN